MGVKGTSQSLPGKLDHGSLLCAKFHDRIAFLKEKVAKNSGLLPSTMHIVKILIYTLGGL